MNDELNFRYQQHDGRNVVIVAAASVVAIPAMAWIGLPSTFLLAGATLGFLIRHFKR